MAYLELLDRKKYADEAQMRHLIRQSLIQTRAIRSMTDKLFEYFLVYATEWEQPAMESLDADGLIGPLWEEYAFTLESEEGKGTVLTASMDTKNIDCLPPGDVSGTLLSLMLTNPLAPDFRIESKSPKGESVFDTRDVRAALGSDIPFNEPSVAAWLKEALDEEMNTIFGGVWI